MNEAIVKWVGADIQAFKPDWSEDKCDTVMGELSGYLENRVVEMGNDVLYYLLVDWVAENEIEEDVEQKLIGYFINDESLVCMTCGYANKDAMIIEPAYEDGYPDGFTCADCCNVITTAGKKED